MIYILSIILSFVIFTYSGPTPPYWGGNPQYTVNVTLLNNNPAITWNMTYHYDWTLKAQRYQHYAPQADQMCLFAKPPFTINDSCTVIFATDGWSYVLYPKYNWCCKCGNSFGAIKYDWLQTGATYVGQTMVNGYSCQHWTKQGLYLNHYYNTVGGLPVKFHQIKLGKPKQWTFNLQSYQKNVDQSLFNPPSGCDTLCSGECKSFRENKQIKNNLKIMNK